MDFLPAFRSYLVKEELMNRVETVLVNEISNIEKEDEMNSKMLSELQREKEALLNQKQSLEVETELLRKSIQSDINRINEEMQQCNKTIEVGSFIHSFTKSHSFFKSHSFIH